ncbi:hypothetical protein AWN88_25655 [Agrobacterium tumefaciens]|nr:hypothetical protein AWN88_25655 [Agrobacterium tumefaciens]
MNMAMTDPDTSISTRATEPRPHRPPHQEELAATEALEKATAKRGLEAPLAPQVVPMPVQAEQAALAALWGHRRHRGDRR